MSRALRIAHVLPFVSADGAFGGPVAVAVEQCRELARQGHRVVLVAGWDGEVDLAVDGVDVRLFRAHALPGLGFSGLVSPAMIAGLRRHVREFDVVHIHLGRHLLALSAAEVCRRAGVPYVLQTHGMVTDDARAKSRILDAVTVRRVLAGARAVLALTDHEQEALGVVSRGRAHVVRVRNGVAPISVARHRDPDAVPEVLFLARLHPRKRVLAFAEMAALLHERGVRARFAVVGPDEGDLPALRAFIAARPGLPLVHEGSIAPGASSERLAAADVYVLPSVREVFPMTVLEAMSVGTPVVLTEDCGIAEELRAAGAASVTDGSASELAAAVKDLLTSPTLGAEIERGVQSSLAGAFGIAAVADELIALYRSAP
ncbi:glycosyltransferase [Clavibacter michiganensis]|uniref:D-inositol 3-phosphate glycosyltransferase n=1 Tax=Clavibacter michiganensis TaxID=28447 RepID=A0A251YTW2_9MICO|nr:glycosyltransferase [Clavibacter michiganensis]OUE27599.1 N,N'-diacetylbacillosaminyl-diphospho-undecaprenol alpha-1,3-N-acetylgalactosaminyltransferase [Clavibacter michiganensis]